MTGKAKKIKRVKKKKKTKYLLAVGSPADSLTPELRLVILDFERPAKHKGICNQSFKIKLMHISSRFPTNTNTTTLQKKKKNTTRTHTRKDHMHKTYMFQV
jgi:hypothetical protein